MKSPDRPIWAVVMAGGSGTRFWPASRASRPKQLTAIVGETTMLQATVSRLDPLVPPERVLVITTGAIADECRAQLPDLPDGHVIAEPFGRDTAPCVALAAEVVAARDPEAVSILLPADHLIETDLQFQETLVAGVLAAEGGALVTYGVVPRFASTGYGYIHLGDLLDDGAGRPTVHRVHRFVEKPDEERAAEYFADGGYRWNSGIFTWRVEAVRAQLRAHCPVIADALAPVGPTVGTDAFAGALRAAYEPLEKISVDYALMERADEVIAVSADFTWDDLGSWDALYDHMPADESGVRSVGDPLAIGTHDALLFEAGGPRVVAVGLDGITIVSTPDAVLVLGRGRGQDVKAVVERLAEEGRDDLR